MKKSIYAAVAGVACMTLMSCSLADTSPSQVALHYSGGPFSSQVFQNCVPNGTLDYAGPSDLHYYYPIGQRTLKFSKDPGSDFPPLQVTSRDGQVLDVSGTVTFTLDTTCASFTDGAGVVWSGGRLQKFHETIAAQDQAYSTEGGVEPGEGWNLVNSKYLKDTIDRSVDNEALKYGWVDLFTDPATKAGWEREVVAKIPELVLSQTGESYYTINSIVLQKPEPSDQLKTELANNQAAVLRGKTAETDKQAALTFPGGIEAYTRYQNQLAVNKAIADGKVPILPIPAGSDLIVNVPR